MSQITNYIHPHFSNLILNPKKVNCVITHKNCSDGFGAAYCAWKSFNNTQGDSAGDKVSFGHNIKYYECLPSDGLPCDITNKNIAIMDITFDKNTMKTILEKAAGLVVLDHHVTGVKNLEDIPEKYKVFDMKHSGAYLAWKYFHPEKEVPLFILYIQDRDLWEKKLPYHEEFVSVFYNLKFTFEEYDTYYDPKNVEKAIEQGKVVRMLEKNNIESIIKHSCLKFCEIKGEENSKDQKYFFVAYCQSNMYISEIGHILLDMYKSADFSCVYRYDCSTNMTYFSLRSKDSRADVEKVARIFGGGGHRNASGCRVHGIVNTLPTPHYEMNNFLRDVKVKTVEYNAEKMIGSDFFLDGTPSYKTTMVCLNATNHQFKILDYLRYKKVAEIILVWYYSEIEYKGISEFVGKKEISKGPLGSENSSKENQKNSHKALTEFSGSYHSCGYISRPDLYIHPLMNAVHTLTDGRIFINSCSPPWSMMIVKKLES